PRAEFPLRVLLVSVRTSALNTDSPAPPPASWFPASRLLVRVRVSTSKKAAPPPELPLQVLASRSTELPLVTWTPPPMGAEFPEMKFPVMAMVEVQPVLAEHTMPPELATLHTNRPPAPWTALFWAKLLPVTVRVELPEPPRLGNVMSTNMPPPAPLPPEKAAA